MSKHDDGGAALTAAQLRVLGVATPEWKIWDRHFGMIPKGMGSLLLSPTINILVDRGLIERDMKPPRWRITDAGRFALSSRKTPETSNVD